MLLTHLLIVFGVNRGHQFLLLADLHLILVIPNDDIPSIARMPPQRHHLGRFRLLTLVEPAFATLVDRRRDQPFNTFGLPLIFVLLRSSHILSLELLLPQVIPFDFVIDAHPVDFAFYLMLSCDLPLATGVLNKSAINELLLRIVRDRVYLHIGLLHVAADREKAMAGSRLVLPFQPCLLIVEVEASFAADRLFKVEMVDNVLHLLSISIAERTHQLPLGNLSSKDLRGHYFL